MNAAMASTRSAQSAESLEEHLNYVRALARAVHQRLPDRVEFDELVQFGVVGLAEARRAFDPGRGVAFRTFAYHRIRGAIFDGLTQLCGAAHTALRRHLLREAALNSVTSDAAVESGTVGRDAAPQRVALVILLSDFTAQGRDRAAPGETPDDDMARRELCLRVADQIRHLPPLERSVMELHYFKGLSLTECGLRLGRHKSWVSRVHSRAIELLRGTLASARPNTAKAGWTEGPATAGAS